MQALAMAAKTLEQQRAFNSQLLSMDANGDGTVDLGDYLASGGTEQQFKALDTAGLGKIPVETAAVVKEEATAAAVVKEEATAAAVVKEAAPAAAAEEAAPAAAEEAAPAAAEEAATAAEKGPGAPSEVTDST